LLAQVGRQNLLLSICKLSLVCSCLALSHMDSWAMSGLVNALLVSFARSLVSHTARPRCRVC
jgi:hypothetical protein